MHLTKEAVQRFQDAHVLVIHEQESDWAGEFEYAQEAGFDLIEEKKRELTEIREAVLKVIPERFHAAVKDDSIYLPGVDPALRDDYLQWQAGESELFEQVLHAAYENKQATLPYLRDKAKEIFAESLHDAQVVKVEQHGQDLWVYFNTTGGFTTKAVVVLKFIGITHQQGVWEENLYYVYDELEKIDTGIAFQMISDGPKSLFIECDTIDAEYYYYPKAYHDFDAEKSWSEYVAMLNEDALYYWIDAQGVRPLDSAHQLIEVAGELLLGEQVLAETVEEAVQHLFTNMYEDPYAHFSEPIPANQLMDAVMSEDMELRVRAWNTMYAEPVELAPIINNLLGRLTVADEDEMMLYVFVRHFYSEGILSADNIEKYRTVIEEE